MILSWHLMSGVLLVYYGYKAMNDPAVLGAEGSEWIPEQYRAEYARRNGQFLLLAGLGVALMGVLDAFTGGLAPLAYLGIFVLCMGAAFAPLSLWCHKVGGSYWPWPGAKKAKKLIAARSKQPGGQDKAGGNKTGGD